MFCIIEIHCHCWLSRINQANKCIWAITFIPRSCCSYWISFSWYVKNVKIHIFNIFYVLFFIWIIRISVSQTENTSVNSPRLLPQLTSKFVRQLSQIPSLLTSNRRLLVFLQNPLSWFQAYSWIWPATMTRHSICPVGWSSYLVSCVIPWTASSDGNNRKPNRKCLWWSQITLIPET